MSDERTPRGFWSSIPGLLTGLAALISAVAALMVAVNRHDSSPGSLASGGASAPSSAGPAGAGASAPSDVDASGASAGGSADRPAPAPNEPAPEPVKPEVVPPPPGNPTNSVPPPPGAGVVVPPPGPGGGVVVPAPMAPMGALQDGVAYLQADILPARTANSAAECSRLCQETAECRAMTFIKSDRVCWLKHAVPATAPHPDMVSAVKIIW